MSKSKTEVAFVTETTIADGYERIGGKYHSLTPVTAGLLRNRGKARGLTDAELKALAAGEVNVEPLPKLRPGQAELQTVAPSKTLPSTPSSPKSHSPSL